MLCITNVQNCEIIWKKNDVFENQLSLLTQNPVFTNSVFSRHKLPENVLELPPTTYPNPLFRLNKSQLLELKLKEIKHLVKIPPRSMSETDQFYKNIIDIFHEYLIKDTKLAVFYLDLITEPLVREAVFEYLRKFYEKELLRLSILAFIEDPLSPACRRAVKFNIYKILDDSREDPQAAANIALNYISKLALTGRVNQWTIFLAEEYLLLLYKNLPKEQWTQLFAALVQTNIKLNNIQHYNVIKDLLLAGSGLDKFVARTGMLCAKWHHTEEPYLSDTQKQKMTLYFLLNELARFTQDMIRQKDVTTLNMYLELLVTKFEALNDPNHLQLVLSIMLSHSMAFKGPQECLQFLRYIVDANLQVVPKTLLRVLTALRLDQFYDEALLLVNYLHKEKLCPTERSNLVSEIIKIITGKFSRHPKIALGYFSSLFNDANNNALRTLKDLLLLDLVYGPGLVNSLFAVVEQAEIHEGLKNSKMTHAILRELYVVTLRSLPLEQRTSPVLISKLYEEYKKKIDEAKETDDELSPFSQDQLDEKILTLFLDLLVRKDAEARDNFDLVYDPFKFATAKLIFNNFFEAQPARNTIKSTYIFDLMISSGLLKHHDLRFSLSAFKKARDLGLPITFNQVNPLIIHHYLKGEMDKAQQWFMLLIQSGAKAKSVAADRLFDIAKEQKWTYTGTRYRNAVRVKLRAARREFAKLSTNPTAGLNIGSDVAVSSASDITMGEELEIILHQIAAKNADENPRK
ncbi:hypothetical protein METBIDRAFT_80097 [Metschnikowia bicuspidata var. bicuspidata NRRL YB-4993]|uniref:Uncharacterized protein n=1 Tax=Metschnikowia bicuspidata var. bicuspidata NRRL YB-4993 TaxID=869754 RepID=A0A1A0H1T6_9ASCO|nr:hypothetical protein METBIDRAFT_80097 [Metschnikowia bicuspidata var. bicuspidata NRRL YB-4993]OBA17991.1 hypothetical protein METBIDRAFT_80097 [Metschnikowia bicuspidata var. bicuspidata NRRL YB-4993]